MDWLERLVLVTGIGIIPIVIIAFVGVVGAIPTYFLWNWLVPDIFGLKAITFWQAMGLIFLSRILFTNFSSSKSSRD